MELVVGATGQLGTALVRRLVSTRGRVRALVRKGSRWEHLQNASVDLAWGDLRDPSSLDSACRGIETVVATANAVIPSRPSSFEQDEEQGYRNLIDACRRQGVRRFVFMSVPVTPDDLLVPTFRLKRRIEEQLRESGIVATVFRGSLIMDDWFPLMGSLLPLRGAEAATLRRPFWFSRLFLAAAGGLVENRGLALVPGSGQTRHAFVTLDDVAEFLSNSVLSGATVSETLDLGGPEVLSWNDVVRIFASVLGRQVRALSVPAGFYRGAQQLLRPFSPAAANLMGLSWLVARFGSPFSTEAISKRFGVSLTRAEDFLRRRRNSSRSSRMTSNRRSR